MTVNIVTGSMLKGLREAGCRITTICKCKGYRTYYNLTSIIFFIKEKVYTPLQSCVLFWFIKRVFGLNMLTSFDVLSLKVSKIGVMPSRGIIKDIVNSVYLLSFCLLSFFFFLA